MCVFCGRVGPPGTEDVTSKWVRKVLNLTSDVTIRADPSGVSARTQHLVVTVDDMVCQPRSNGRMSRLRLR